MDITSSPVSTPHYMPLSQLHVWLQPLSEREEKVETKVEPKATTCLGCNYQIVEGCRVHSAV